MLGWVAARPDRPVHIDLVHVHNRPKRHGTLLMTGQHATRRSAVVNGIIFEATKFGPSAKGSLRARTPTDPSPDDAAVGGCICTEGQPGELIASIRIADRHCMSLSKSLGLRSLPQVNGRPNAI